MPKTENKTVALPTAAANHERRELLKRTYAKGSTDDEFALFVGIADRTGLDIAARQIFLVKRWDSRERREVMQVQTSIDGFRLIADRSGKYEGQMGPLWCGPDGLWHDVWIPDEPPVAARVGVLKTGCREPFWSVAKYAEYAQTDRDGKLVSMWRKMPANQLAKCAEALSLRKAFPQEMSGLYTGDEMAQVAGNGEPADLGEKPWSRFKEMLTKFAALKSELGPDRESTYYKVLAAFGVAHANEFRNSEQALTAYRQLEVAIENFPDPPTQPNGEST